MKPGEEISFAYAFTPDPSLEPREWGVVTEIFYSDEVPFFHRYDVWRPRIADCPAQDRLNFSTPFVNTTVVLFESDSSLDAQTYAVSVSFLTPLTADG